MNAQESFTHVSRTKPIVATIAIILCLLGMSVIYAWHSPSAFGTIHHTITKMAYNSAICVVLSGVALIALLQKQLLVVRSCAVIMVIISALTFIESLGGPAFNVNYWFISKPVSMALDGGLMSPTTAVCLMLLNTSLLLFNSIQPRITIFIIFLNLVNLTVTLIAILGHGIGLVPAFVWLGIKMAPHTAIALSIFSIAIIIHIHHPATKAFNQLNFFNRIVIGFGFMAILVIAIGSVALMQIHTVSSLTHELYENPLQTSNATQKIKTEVIAINRQLKNIAIQKEKAGSYNIPRDLENASKKIKGSILLIKNNDPDLKDKISSLENEIDQWEKYTLESWQILNTGNFESFSARTIANGKEYVLTLEYILDRIADSAQQKIANLNTSVTRTEDEARQLVIVIVTAFLIAGLTVASLITRGLTQPLNKIRQTMLAIANEKLTWPIPYRDHPDEIGEMARALEIFQDSFAARRDLETRLLQVIEAMPNGIIMVNELGTIEIVNLQAEKIFGYDRKELLGKSIEQLIPQDAANAHSHNRESYFTNPSPRTMGAGRELFGLRRDGTEFPLEIGLAPVTTKDGIKVLASIVDITERRNANIALNESRERLELTTRVNQIGVWEYLVDDDKLIWNDAMFEIYGRNKNYFTYNYHAWQQCIHPNDLANTEQQFQSSLKSMTPLSCKFRIIQPDGTIKNLQAKAKIERTAQNRLRILGTNIDITREERALEKIHNLEILRSAIVEFSEDAIISKTPTGIITSWNLGAQNIFGYSAAETVGRPIKELVFPPELIDEEEMLLAQVRAGQVIKHFETRRRCKDGRIINVSITLSPIKDADGNIIGISAIKRDITEYIETAKILASRQSELEHSNQELERSNKELETFAYVASHDLKSPLRGIAQLSTWIEEDLAANEVAAVTDHTLLLRNRIQRMEKLLDDLLLFYRAGKTEGNIIDIDVNQMAIDIFEIQNNKPGLRLECINELPKFTTLVTPFELIIRNLFSNAIKHHDKPEGIIQISSRQLDNGYLEFSVSDDGPGIPEKFHSRIFGMFQTLKPRDELEGSGMGLALIKKIIETYGGYVTLKSSGRGSCFSFSWPKTIRRRQEND